MNTKSTNNEDCENTSGSGEDDSNIDVLIKVLKNEHDPVIK